MRSLPETPRLVLTLTLAGLLSGLAIVSAYRLTLPRIQENQARALREAVFEVVPGSEAIQRLVVEDGSLVPAAASAGDADGESIYAAYDESGGFLGYAIPAAGAGFQDTIKLIYGYDPATGNVIGMQILESREPPGLGDRIYKDAGFVAEFRELAVEPRIELVKGAGDEANEVDAITGATISCAAVVSILNAGNEQWLDRLPAEPPPLSAADDAPPRDLDRGGPIPGGRIGD